MNEFYHTREGKQKNRGKYYRNLERNFEKMFIENYFYNKQGSSQTFV